MIYMSTILPCLKTVKIRQTKQNIAILRLLCKKLSLLYFLVIMKMHLGIRLKWQFHILNKTSTEFKSSGIKLLARLYFEIINKEQHFHAVFLKPIWTYVIKLWGIASNNSIETISIKTLWYASNEILHNDVNVSTVKEDISK